MATQIGELKYSVGFDVKKQDLNSLKKQLQQLSKFTISDLMKINNTDRDSATKALNNIREQAQRVKDALNAAFNAKLDTINIETFNKTLKDSGSSLQQVYNTFQKSGVAGQNAFRSLVTQITTTNVQLKQSHKWLDNIATTLGNTIKWNIASTAVNTLSNSVQQAWGFVKSLDTSLNDIRIVTGKSADQMANFAVQANDAAKSLGKTTVDYTKAALIYAQQGLNDDEVAARAAITLKTANVTGQSTDAVSEQLTSVWNGYKVNAEQAELYIDRLAAVAATTASDLEELSTGMSKVASAAAAMGVGEDQLAAQLSTIISVTRQAPESVGTALRTIYARISDIKAGIDEDGVTLGNYSGKMAELGFNVLDANGKLRDMGQVIEDIGSRWQDLTREQQVSLAQTMAGQRQYSNLIALFDNFQEYNRALSTAQNAAGTLQKQQDIYMESTRAHLNQLKAATENLYDSLVNPDAMEPLIDGLSTAATAAAKFVDAIGGGGNLLLSLGGIAVNVFSGHLTKGIQTFVHNFTLGNQQVKIMEANLETLNSIDLSGVDNNTAGMIDTIKRTETALSKNATSEEFKEMNNILNQIKTAVNEYAIIDKETENLEKQFSKAQKATGMKYKDMADYLDRAADQYDRFDKILDTTSNGYDKAADAADQFINAVVQQNGSVKIGKENIEQLKKALQDIKNTDFSLPGFQEPRQDIDNTLHALEQIQNKNLSDSEYKKFIEKIKQHFKDLRDATQITTDVIQEQINKQGEATGKINQELESSDEKLKEIGKQETIRSIGKLIGSFTQLGTSVNITASAIRQLKKGNIGSGLSALSASLTSVVTAAVSAGKAIHALGATVSAASLWGVALGAISLVTSALVAHKQAAEEDRKAQIELNNTTIENQQKNQEQIDKKQQLLLAVKDLNEEYENGQITRAQLRQEIEKLTNQYGIEQEYIDQLIDRYGSLTQGIRQARIEEAKRKQESFQTELNAAKGNIEKVNTNSTISSLTEDLQKSYFSKALSSYGNGITTVYDEEIDALIGSIAYLPKEIDEQVALYNFLSTELQKHKDDILYEGLKKWYNDFSESIEKYNDIKEKLDSYLDYDIYSNSYADFDKTKTFEEYRKQRQQLINNVAKNDSNSVQEVTRAVDKYLKQNYKGLQGQYDEALRYVDELEKRFGTLDQKILNSILELDAAHLDALEREDVGTWEELEKTLERVSKLDLSNVQNLVNTNPETLNQKASDRYVFFQSLQDQVNSGKNISSKEIDRFKDYGVPELKQFFTMMANGQYQMTEDVKKFNEVVNNLKLTGFFEVADALQKKAQQLEKFNELLNKKYYNDFTESTNFDFENLKNPALLRTSRSQLDIDRTNRRTSQTGIDSRVYNQITQDKVNKYKIQDQLEYIKIYKEQANITQELINKWETLNNLGDLKKQQAYDIADAVRKIGDKTETFNSDIDSVNQNLQQTEHQIYKILFPTDADVNETVLNQLSKTLQQLSSKSEELDSNLQNNLYIAEQVAEAILRFDNAIQDVIDHYDDWLLALSQQTISLQDQAELFPQLRDAYADMLDIDGSLLSDEFLASTQNLEWMKAAIDGDIQAYDNLAEAARIAALQMLKIDPSIDMSHFEEDLAYLKNYLNNRQNFPSLEIGAELNDANFLEQLSRMVTTMGVTAAQASDILRENLGIDTEIIEVKDVVKQVQQFPVTNAVLQPVQDDGYVTVPISTGRGYGKQRLNLPHKVFSTKYQPDVESIETTKQGSSFALKVTSANKSAGGHFKYTHASRGAGSAGTARRKAAAQKAAKSSKSSEPKPDTSTKQLKDPMQDTRDIYHDINIELRDIATDLNRIQKQQEKLYGKQLIKNLTKQSEILEQQKAKLKQKNDLQRLDLRQKKEELELLGLTFDKYDNISNYLDILGNKQGEINGLIEQQNGLIQSYNAITEKEAKDAIKNQIDLIEKQKQRADNEYKNIQNKIKTYDSLKNDFQSVLDQITEKTNKQIEISIKKFNMEIEIRLDLGEAEREWNKFRKQVLQGYDLLNDTNFNKISRDALEIRRNYQSYFDVQNSNSVQSLTQHIKDIRDQIQLIDETGWSPIYGDDKQQAMDDLKNYYNLQINQLEEIQQLIHDIDQAYLDTIDDIKDNFDSQIADYQFVTDLLEHDIDLIQLLYGDKQYEAMNAYYEQLHANGVLEIDSLRKQADYWKQMWEAAEGTEDAKKYKQAWMDTVSKLRDEIGNQIQNAQNQYINAINQIFDTLDRRLTNGLGFDYVELEWELIKKNADEYLDTINSAYALQQLQNKFNKAINETKDVKAQKALTDLMNQQLESLRAKEKLTQYDVDRAEKLLQIQQARMQLEETRNAKTSLRLKRDSQGNYSYVYTANQEQVEQAEDTLARLQNQLYNFDKDAYRRNLDDVLSAYREWKNKIIEVYSDLHMNAEDRERAIAAINEYYEQYITDKVSENNVIRLNLMNSAFEAHSSLYGQDYTAFANMLDSQKQKLIGQWIPEWNSSLQTMADQFKTGFIAKCTEAFRDIEAATDDYENKVHELQSAANEDFGKLKDGIDEVANSFTPLIENNDQLINRMNEQMGVIQNLRNELQQLRQKYAEIYEEAKRAMEQTHNFIRKQDLQAADAAANAPQGLPEEIKPEPVQLPPKPASSTPVPSSSGSSGGSNSGSSSGGSSEESLPYWPVDTPSRIIEGIAGSIWLFGSQSKSWNNQPQREKRLKQVFGETAGPEYYRKAQELFNVGLNGRRYGYDALPAHGIDYDYYDYWTYDAWKKRKQEQLNRRTGKFDTGGYTGEWGPDGRLAVLHQKELVLNAQDTKNMLDSVSIIRNVVSNLGGNISAKLRSLSGGYIKPVQPKPADELQQSVNIQASFPAVNSKREIEEAFSELVNMAAQRAMRRI